jgi:hypothetical protein
VIAVKVSDADELDLRRFESGTELELMLGTFAAVDLEQYVINIEWLGMNCDFEVLILF